MARGGSARLAAADRAAAHGGGQPPLATVDMRLERLGQHAARRLLAAIGGEPASGLEQLPYRLVIRESSGTRRG